MATYTTRRIGQLLKTAVTNNEMDRFFFLQAERARAKLMDHIGGCERILKTPLATVFSIKIRRFLFLYLMILPIATVDTSGVAHSADHHAGGLLAVGTRPHRGRATTSVLPLALEPFAVGRYLDEHPEQPPGIA